MKNLTKTILTLLAAGTLSCALFSPSAQAVPITGAITFDGGATFDDPSLALATTVMTWYNTSVMSVSGSFADLNPLLGNTTMFTNGWNFAPGGGTALNSLWTTSNAGNTVTFSFDIGANDSVSRPIIGGYNSLSSRVPVCFMERATMTLRAYLLLPRKIPVPMGYSPSQRQRARCPMAVQRSLCLVLRSLGSKSFAGNCGSHKESESYSILCRAGRNPCPAFF